MFQIYLGNNVILSNQDFSLDEHVEPSTYYQQLFGIFWPDQIAAARCQSETQTVTVLEGGPEIKLLTTKKSTFVFVLNKYFI